MLTNESFGSELHIAAPLQESRDVVTWVQRCLDGLRIEKLKGSRRNGLGSGCWHVAVEHSQAIVVLVEHGLYGSALAMIRPLFEAYVRGAWLVHVASEAAVESASNDRFPDCDTMLRGLKDAGLHQWVEIKEQWWKRLCSLTHTGTHQIVPRLTAEGLGYNYDGDAIREALGWADGLSILTVVGLANLAENQPLAMGALERMRSAAGRSTEVRP